MNIYSLLQNLTNRQPLHYDECTPTFNTPLVDTFLKDRNRQGGVSASRLPTAVNSTLHF